MKVICGVSFLLIVCATIVSCQTDSTPASSGGSPKPGGGKRDCALKMALQPLGLQAVGKQLARSLKAQGKTRDQIRPLLDGLASEITQLGDDRSKVLDRLESFASKNGLSSSMQSAITAAKSASG